MAESELKETPLVKEHIRLGAKMVGFGGWNMPVQYTNVIDEHVMTRAKAGLFDICHMGEFIVRGLKSKEFLQKLCLNDLDKLYPGKAQYSMFCNENGGVVDDIFVYQLAECEFMIVTNAGTIEKDYSWMRMHKTEEVEIINMSGETAKLDLQGPLSEEILQKLCDTSIRELRRFHFIDTEVDNIKCKISRTGYTGEKGFELYFNAKHAVQIWNRILETGGCNIKPVGLGARDTLRLEACYSLYGHELNDNITPVEASLSWVVKEKEFIGSSVVQKQKKQGAVIMNVAFEMIDTAVPREHYEITKHGEKIGEVSSGTYSPTFKKGIGMAFVKREHIALGTEINIIIRGKGYKARIVNKPFYKFNG